MADAKSELIDHKFRNLDRESGLHSLCTINLASRFFVYHPFQAIAPQIRAALQRGEVGDLPQMLHFN